VFKENWGILGLMVKNNFSAFKKKNDTINTNNWCFSTFDAIYTKRTNFLKSDLVYDAIYTNRTKFLESDLVYLVKIHPPGINSNMKLFPMFSF
jgi:uncharacterized protein YabN with tetrapyrrole methylase and pyrophosphatase domain